MTNKQEMNYEYSYGAILYRKIFRKNEYEYLIVKDRNNNYSFPKGHKEKGETPIQTAIREVKEECNIVLQPDKHFLYPIWYKLNENTTKHVSLYSGDFGLQQYKINDNEIQEIKVLSYEDAYNLITFQEYKDALKEVNERLTKGMIICCMFDEEDPYKAYRNKKLEHVKSYGSRGYGHNYYVWDDGSRYLTKCKKCGGYVLVQNHEMHMPDHTYIDFFPVRDESHAEEVNMRYDGYGIEAAYPYKSVLVTFDY